MRTPITSTKLLIHTLQQVRTQDLKLGGAGDKRKKNQKNSQLHPYMLNLNLFF